MALRKNIVCGGEAVRYGHLERLEVKLRTLSPVFIGSGEKLTKKEYIYDRNKNRIYIPDLAKLTGYLSKRGLIPAFEKFFMHPSNNDLYTFFSGNNIGNSEYSNFIAYSINAGEVANEEKFRELLMFTKGPDGKPYIPGSSIKGALRTAIAAKLLEKGSFESEISSIEKSIPQYNLKRSRRYLALETRNIERKLFCKLKPDSVKWYSQVNDFMRGIQVSDSTPIEYEYLTICGKYDRNPDGTINQLPIYRECLVPDTTTMFVITLDMPLLAQIGIDVSYIEDALCKFANMQYNSFEKYFPTLPIDYDNSVTQGVEMVLGGGAGYITKTIIYPLIQPRQRAVKAVEKMMIKMFPGHKHEADSNLHKVSPHTIKTTEYKGRYYLMGKCEIIF